VSVNKRRKVKSLRPRKSSQDFLIVCVVAAVLSGIVKMSSDDVQTYLNLVHLR